jgi:YD repeat-containing protein
MIYNLRLKSGLYKSIFTGLLGLSILLPIQARNFGYDGAGRVIWSIQPECQNTSFSYDANGNVLAIASMTSGEDSDGDGIPDYFELKFTGLKTGLSASVDGDSDGLTNFVEFAFGRNPVLQDGHRLSNFQFTAPDPITGEVYFIMTYQRPKSATQLLTYGTQFSTDLLAPWTTGTSLTVETQVSPQNGGLEEVTVRYLTPLDALDIFFMRITVGKQ